MQRILLIDLKAVLHSVKFSIGKQRLAHNEKHTFVIFGFLLKLQYMLKKTKSNVVVYALDSDTSKRKEIFALYKSNRQNKTEQQEALDELAYPQFDEITNYVLPRLGYRNIFGAEGFEADDIIGRICKSYKNDQIILCSTDKDMYQLLTENVCILNPKNSKYYTITDFEKEYEIEPKIWKRVKAIGGCSSDTVPGVPIPQPDPNKKQQHVAEKGALNYLTGKMKPSTKAYQAIISREGKDRINRNKALVILPFRNTPKFSIRPDHPKKSGLIEVCEKYGFESILDDLNYWTKILRMR